MSDWNHWLITGAAGAIGGAIARSARARWPFARLTLVDLHLGALSELADELGGPVDSRRWDLANVETLANQWADATARLDVDVLVNCAGFMEVQRFQDFSWELGERLLRVDLVSQLRLMDLAVPTMIEAGRGAVVNVASMAGVTPIRGCSYYGAAKSGLAMASEIARLELEPQGVRVVTVYPGPVSSDLERRAREQVGASLIARAMPTGHPDVLAGKVVDAVENDEARVVYPPTYAAAFRGRAEWRAG